MAKVRGRPSPESRVSTLEVRDRDLEMSESEFSEVEKFPNGARTLLLPWPEPEFSRLESSWLWIPSHLDNVDPDVRSPSIQSGSMDFEPASIQILATMTASAGAFARLAGGPRCRLTRAHFLSAPVLRMGCFRIRWNSNGLGGTVWSESPSNVHYDRNFVYGPVMHGVYCQVSSVSTATSKLLERKTLGPRYADIFSRESASGSSRARVVF